MLGLGADLVNLSQGELSLQGKPLCGDPSVPHRPSPLTESGSSAPILRAQNPGLFPRSEGPDPGMSARTEPTYTILFTNQV